MVQLTPCWPYKHKDLSLIPKTYVNSSAWWHIFDTIELRRQR